MNPLGGIGPESLEAVDILKVFFDLAVKSTLLVCLAGLAALLLRRKSSATIIGLIWTFTIAAVVLLPAFILVTPQLNVPVMPDMSTWLRSHDDELTASIIEAGRPPVYKRPDSDSGKLSGSVEENGQAGSAGTSLIPELHWSTWIALVLLAGSALLLVRRLIGRGVLYWIRRKAIPLGDARLARILEKEAAGLGLKRKVAILKSDITSVAFTCGMWNAALILPSSVEEWDEERLRVVLLHELAHVKRGDLLLELLAQLATVLYWFNPLVWLAAYRLRVERERACDDSVINMGVRQSEYATQLMTVAGDLELHRQPLWQAATISQGASLKNRLLCILSPKRRRSTRQGLAAVLIGLVVVVLALPLAAFDPWQESPVEKYLLETGNERLLSLLGDLRNPNPQVRMQALWSLSKLSDERAGLAVRTALNDPDPGIRASAIETLAAKGDEGSIPYFVDSLLDADYRIRAAAATAMVELLLNEKSAVREIALKNLQIQAGNKNKSFSLLVNAMSNCGTKERTLLSADLYKATVLYNSAETRLTALKTLADSNDPHFFLAFSTAIIKDKWDKNRHLSVAHLGKLKVKNVKVHDALVQALLKDSSSEVRGKAAWAIGEIGDIKAESALKKATGDSDKKVQKEVEIALKKLSKIKQTGW